MSSIPDMDKEMEDDVVSKVVDEPRVSTRSVKIIPFAPDRLSFSIPRGASTSNMLSYNTSSDDLISNGATLADGGAIRPNVAALRAIGKLKLKQKDRADKRRQQVVDTDRHHAILKQYTIRAVTKKTPIAEQKLPWHIVNPSATWYKTWQLMTLGIICYQSFQTPYSLAFSDANSNPLLDYFSITTNTIFGIDTLLNFNTAIADPVVPDKYITNRKKIIKSYICGWFVLDLMACFPIDIVMYIALNQASSSSHLSILSLLKSLRLPRLLRLARLVRVLKILQMPVEWKRWILYSRYSHLIRLVTMILAFIFVVHIMACVWNGSVATIGWQNTAFQQGTTVDLYVLSYFFTLVTLVGQNMALETQGEYMFSIYLLLMGSMLMAIVFGNVANLLSNFYENQNSYKKKMEWLFESMGSMQLPLDLQNRINEYYQVMWERHGTLDGQVSVLTQELSRNLAIEVELYLRMEMISRVPIFHNCSKKVVQEIVMRLEMDVYLPGDYVVVHGEIAWEMYFVQSGICEVTKGRVTAGESSASLTDEEVVLRQLTQGDFFGEIALLMQCKRTANVRAQIFSELCVLTRDVFELISAKFLEDRMRIEEVIVKRYHPDVLKQIEVERHEAKGIHVALHPEAPSVPNDNDASTKILAVLGELSNRLGNLERKVQNIEDAQRHCFNKIFTALQVRKKKPPLDHPPPTSSVPPGFDPVIQ
ncbi:hypothetical protein SPRG_19016 [Saprolegnia parasitica CBS 223.65]|uniref:Cyclic nucleotide-binding domain-containing protein n=1 Tax=Saprolegnia parasitica (strain CBS 223.65) TaxID=695850 RepID=A0A067CTY5_SAPPC|nr:hypothetical protein SPRG_19016 [Saprolegnia parasitica CBS 223.65]KDO34164.1 hypothetical protein SPRG_19016 [Saprolegnia parasitica CBS 223.65]|eukprot:XP_012195215.1 hypothetical protein SPRG_19016 [Saprolegnia parasitica CBS 223.65]